jgi:type IV secretion system protein VirB10
MSLERGLRRPGVALARGGVPLPLLLMLVGVLGAGLFVSLEARRAAQVPGPPAMAMVATPDIPPLPVAPPLAGEVQVATRAVFPAAMRAPAPRRAPGFVPGPAPSAYARPYATPAGLVGEEPLRAPRPVSPHAGAGGPERGGALVLDLTAGGGAAVNGAALTGGAGAGGADAAGDDTVRAAPMHGRATIIAQGTVMDAVLETPLNSDRPGLARAIVGEDVRSFDGSRVLIPRGSRLLGDFKAETSPGQRRVLVTWTRLIRPDGIAIRIASPAVDPLGGAGVPGAVNTHFAERFAAAVLQSALAVGVNLASTLPVQGAGALYLGLPSGQGQQLGAALAPSANRAATVKVKEGTRIAVLVAHDLDFAGTPLWR